MKKEEIIEINGVEYTATLSRESYVRIDRVAKIADAFRLMNERVKMYDYIDKVDDDYNPYADEIDLDSLEDKYEEKLEAKEQKIKNFYTRGLHVLLYPKHEFKISQIEEILNPIYEDSNKLIEFSERFGQLLGGCIQMKFEYEEERKNLKAQANKK